MWSTRVWVLLEPCANVNYKASAKAFTDVALKSKGWDAVMLNVKYFS